MDYRVFTIRAREDVQGGTRDIFLRLTVSAEGAIALVEPLDETASYVMTVPTDLGGGAMIYP